MTYLSENPRRPAKPPKNTSPGRREPWWKAIGRMGSLGLPYK